MVLNSRTKCIFNALECIIVPFLILALKNLSENAWGFLIHRSPAKHSLPYQTRANTGLQNSMHLHEADMLGYRRNLVYLVRQA